MYQILEQSIHFHNFFNVRWKFGIRQEQVERKSEGSNNAMYVYVLYYKLLLIIIYLSINYLS